MTGPRTHAGRADAGAVVVVAIGRNEGERLVRCLASVPEEVAAVVYVDSGSTDGSVEAARAAGAHVVELDLSVPFTAARARNAGASEAARVAPGHAWIQFVDGDCEIDANWIDRALAFAADRPDAAVLCGRRRERAPDASPWNRLCDMEWNTPVGEAASCGGDALVRRDAFEAVGGFDPSVIAGEEPELCVRLRAGGGTVHRLDLEMTRHDAAMTSVRQWWRRSVRAGHAYLEGAMRHGRGPSRHWTREAASTWVWAVGWPLALVAASVLVHPLALAGGLVYPLHAAVIARRRRREFGDPWPHAGLYGASTIVARWAHLQGHLTYLARRVRGGPSRIIEYKTASAGA